MFLVVGLITVTVGIVVMFLLPDNPMSSKFMTHDEKVFAIQRLRENQTGIENKHFKFGQVGVCSPRHLHTKLTNLTGPGMLQGPADLVAEPHYNCE